MVDFLPAMYMYEYIMLSKRPDQIASYDTIVYPFDAYIWIFITISMIAQFLALFIMQNVWSISSGASNPKDYIFQGSNQPIHIMPWNIKLQYISVIVPEVGPPKNWHYKQ